MDSDKEIMISGRGVLKLTFMSSDFEAKKVRYYKTLFLQIACRNRLNPERFTEKFGALPVSGASSFVSAVIKWMDSSPANAAGLADWLYEGKYLTDADVMGALGAKVVPTPVQSEHFAPSKPDAHKQYPIWVEIDGSPDKDGFLITIGRDGKVWTYPDPMGIDDTLSCVRWLVERHALPWAAVKIPVSVLAEQADKSLTCKRALKMAQQEGIPV